MGAVSFVFLEPFSQMAVVLRDWDSNNLETAKSDKPRARCIFSSPTVDTSTIGSFNPFAGSHYATGSNDCPVGVTLPQLVGSTGVWEWTIF